MIDGVDARWEILVRAGVPLGAGALDPAPPLADLRRALADVVASPLSALQREVLGAWLCAWRSHWPASFSDALGPRGDGLVERLSRDADPNRHIKLRRIALSRLGSVL